jgi:hypothetical protein
MRYITRSKDKEEAQRKEILTFAPILLNSLMNLSDGCKSQSMEFIACFTLVISLDNIMSLSIADLQ